jgi:hypothetical protein
MATMMRRKRRAPERGLEPASSFKSENHFRNHYNLRPKSREPEIVKAGSSFGSKAIAIAVTSNGSERWKRRWPGNHVSFISK